MRLICLFIFIPIVGFTQFEKPIKSKLIFQGKETTIENPTHIIQLYDSIFIDKTELCNIHWLEYLFSIKKDSSTEFYQAQLPDNFIFTNIGTKQNPNFVDYFEYPSLRYYPLLNISYEQAQNYCKWRTDVINAVLKANQRNDKKAYEMQVEYRLPTKKEWEFAASGGLELEKYPNGIIEKFRKLKEKDFQRESYEPANECKDSLHALYKKRIEILEYTANVKEDFYIPQQNSVVECDDYYAISTSEVYHFLPNKYGLYDMIGNVAEMVQEKGIAKGGSYRNSYDSINIQKDFSYDSPKDWLGFRCVCVIHLKKK